MASLGWILLPVALCVVLVQFSLWLKREIWGDV